MKLFNFSDKRILSPLVQQMPRLNETGGASLIHYEPSHFNVTYPDHNMFAPVVVEFRQIDDDQRHDYLADFEDGLLDCTNRVKTELFDDEQNQRIVLFSTNMMRTLTDITNPCFNNNAFEDYWVDLISLKLEHENHLKEIASGHVRIKKHSPR